MENIILSPISLDALQRMISDCVAEAVLKSTPQSKSEEVDARLTIPQMAEYLNCSKNTIHVYIRSNSLPFHKVGRRTYFLKQEVDAALSSVSKKKGNKV